MIDGIAQLRAWADAAAIVGDREVCLRLHETIAQLEFVIAALEMLRAKLEVIESPLGSSGLQPERRIDA